MDTIVRTGRHAPRSRTGCSTCRIRKVKCDEQRPICSKCALARIQCEWDRPLPPRRPTANHSVKRTETTMQKSQALLKPAKQTADSAYLQGSDGDSESDIETTIHGAQASQSLTVRNNAHSVFLPPTISMEYMEMSNSLVLNPQDLRSFQYVPESLMVMRFGKPWRWSMISFLHTKIAPRASGVMNAFIAVASMELRFRDLVKYQDGVITQSSLERAAILRSSATSNIHQAIKYLSLLLNRLSTTESTPDDIEALFSIWFLILHCGLYDPELIRSSQIHLNGIRSFIAKYLQGEDGMEIRRLPPASQQLLIFITYLDMHIALSNLNGGQLCLDLMSIPRESALAYDRLWEAARICLPQLWGAEYPAEEILDDVENYRGLGFLHSCQKLKLSIWQLAIATGQGKATREAKSRLWNQIEEIGHEFTDLLTLAKITRNSGGRRVMWTIYHGCLDYYAVRVLFGCLDMEDSSPEWLNETLSDLLAIAHKSLGEDPQQLYRTVWPLAVASLKVRDPIHRDWIQAQLRRARVLLSGIGLPSRLLDEPSSLETLFLEYSRNNLIEEAI